MMRNEIRWFSVTREFLPSALFGNVKNAKYGPALTFGAPRPDMDSLALGYTTSERQDSYNPPALIVINSDSAKDILSWLRTFAPATSPLSQFARVVTDEDWERLSNDPRGRRYAPVQREDRWACLVLGEALAQADGETEINSIPISIASSCFSTAIARTATLYGTDEATATCADRLKQLESDRRFQQRTISIAELIPPWNTMAMAGDEDLPPAEAAALVLDAVSKFGINAARAAAGIKIPTLSDFRGLFSDSIEERVMTYQKMMNELMRSPSSVTRDTRANALVAAAAFLVGRGTSHSFLIRRAIKTFTSSFIWYGVIAALAGSSTWDENWSRAVKGIERLLRSKFEWTDSPSTDLSWVEYSWLARVFDGADVFHDIPKMFPRGLSIEVLPGATCQLRFSDMKTPTAEPELKQKAEPSLRERELEATLAQFLNLATKARQLIEGTPPSSTSTSSSVASPTQHALGFEDLKPPTRIIRTNRRTKRTSE